MPPLSAMLPALTASEVSGPAPPEVASPMVPPMMALLAAPVALTVRLRGVVLASLPMLGRVMVLLVPVAVKAASRARVIAPV